MQPGKLHPEANEIQRDLESQKGQLGAKKSSKAKERSNGGGRGGKTKHLPAGHMTCFPQEIKTHKSLNMWHYACPPKPMPGRRNKRLGEGEGVAALAGKVLNNQWFGLRLQSLRTLAHEKGMGKQHFSKVSVAGACASTADPLLWTGDVLSQCLSCTWAPWAMPSTQSNGTSLRPRESLGREGEERDNGLQILPAVAVDSPAKREGRRWQLQSGEVPR